MASWVGCTGKAGVWVSVLVLSESVWVTFVRVRGLPDSHQACQLGLVAHTSCQSASILPGIALVTWVKGGEAGICCCRSFTEAMVLSASTREPRCCCSLSLLRWFSSTKVSRECSSFLG